MELIPGRFISRLFWAELHALGGPDVGNLLGWIYRDKGEETWRFEYRFRYYVDGDLTHKSKDRKSGYSGSTKPGQSLAQVLALFRVIFEASGAGQYEEIMIESDDPAVVIGRMKEQPWAHVSQREAE
jgi:hypothetical protein